METKEEALARAENFYMQSATYKHSFMFKTNYYAYLWDKGVIVIHLVKGSGKYATLKEAAYSWQKFEIKSFYRYGVDENKQNYYEFILNAQGRDELYSDKTWNEMLRILFDKTNDQSKYKNIIKTLLNIYFRSHEIPEMQVCDYLGYSPENGWQLPDKYLLNRAGSDIRSKVSEMMMKNLVDVSYTEDQVIVDMKKLYDITGIQYKDYFFAFGCVGGFIPAIKKEIRIAPPVALGGDPDKGKTPMAELISAKWWGHVESGMGESFHSIAQFQHYLSSAALPFLIDDCEDLPAKLVGIIKRMTTQKNPFKKLNADQSTRMSADLIGVLLFTYNNYPALFQHVAMRKRMVNFIIESIQKHPDWNEFYNALPAGEFGWLVIQKTKGLTFRELMKQYNSMDGMGYKDRMGYIIKYYQLGAYFMKQWFNIELDIKELPVLIRETIATTDEDLISLIVTMVNEGTNFIMNDDGILFNPNKSSWVKRPIETKTYNARGRDNPPVDGILIHFDNVQDLCNHLRVKITSASLATTLKEGAGWNDVMYANFTKKGVSVRAIFVPKKYIDGTFSDEREIQDMIESGKNDDFFKDMIGDDENV